MTEPAEKTSLEHYAVKVKEKWIEVLHKGRRQQ